MVAGRYIVLVAVLAGTMQRLASAEAVSYVGQIKPIFAARCYACHGALKQRNDLRVDTVQLIKRGGKEGPAVLPFQSKGSLLMAHIANSGDYARMPPEGELLKPEQIRLIRQWIDEGAIGPGDETPESDPRDHWSFRPPVRPNVQGAGNPIDGILSADWLKRGLHPQPPADASILLRRLYFDLTGLPPTLEDQQRFAADHSPEAYLKTVDRLLASPQYGEHWGRHWMDVWRYSDAWGLGAEVRNSARHIWHWRDWIIESLNADKGYDQMVREMLAADELYPTDENRLRATGFLARQYFLFNRNTWLEETVEHTSKAFLGLTMNCTKCHDHKYDPMVQRDFYRLRAFFEPYQVRMDMAPGQADLTKDAIPRAFDCNLDIPTYRFKRGDERQPLKDEAIEPGVPAILEFERPVIRPVQLPAEAYVPTLRKDVGQALLIDAEHREQAALQALADVAGNPDQDAEELSLGQRMETRLLEAEADVACVRTKYVRVCLRADAARFTSVSKDESSQLAIKAAELSRQYRISRLEETVAKVEAEIEDAGAKPNTALKKKLSLARADVEAARRADKAASAKHDASYDPLVAAEKSAESNVETPASRQKPFPATSTGRRSALAAWLTDSRNPLPARVAANHIWARHMGQPIVATMFDFGRKGTAPTNQALLDLLATELRDHGWSMKNLHRLIVTSQAYQMSSSAAGADATTLKTDADNRYYWRMNPIRLESQQVRDSLIWLAGDLDQTMGGPPIPIADDSSHRRSLYFVHSHNDQQKFLNIFDDANVLDCYRRAESIIPQQSLAMENSRLVLAAAEKIADRIQNINDAAFIQSAFILILGSTPNAQEQSACLAALADFAAAAPKASDRAKRARVDLIHALLNHNDFITVR